MSAAPAVLPGRCHCGNLELVLTTARRPEQLALRADGCSFCRKHGARTTTDPHGQVRIVVHDAARLLRYQFALRTADFLVCGRCGVYLAAMLSTPTGAYATLNVNTFDCADALPQAVVPVSYDGETAKQRIARRQSNWTPVVDFKMGESRS
jgi:hypothetical protein